MCTCVIVLGWLSVIDFLDCSPLWFCWCLRIDSFVHSMNEHKQTPEIKVRKEIIVEIDKPVSCLSGAF